MCVLVTGVQTCALPICQGGKGEAVHQTPRFLGKGWFDHDAHKETACADCHTTAPRSKQASDLLVPGLSQCRDCHVGESGARLAKVETATASPCAMCHEYPSDGGKPWVPARQRRTPVIAITGAPPPQLSSVAWPAPGAGGGGCFGRPGGRAGGRAG